MLNPTDLQESRLPAFEDLAEPTDEDNARAAAQATTSALAVNMVEPTR
jgi:hypothetical protein